MDLYVPGEILAQIASFLSKKDCNSLSRTSKTAYNKLDSYRNILPKAEMNMALRWDTRYMSLTAYTSEHRWNDPANWMVDVFSSPDEPITDAAEAQDQLLTYFKQQKVSPTRVHFQLRQFNGSELCLDILFSHFHINMLFLDWLNFKNCKLISRYMREKRLSVAHVYMRAKRLPSCTFELINACKPNQLTMEGEQTPEGFFQAQVIRNLSRLFLMIINNEMCDRDLLSLNAHTLRIQQLGEVTANGLISFISEWLEHKREIKEVSLRAYWSNWRRELAALDSDLVDIDITEEIIAQFRATLYRRSDGQVLYFTSSAFSISIRA